MRTGRDCEAKQRFAAATATTIDIDKLNSSAHKHKQEKLANKNTHTQRPLLATTPTDGGPRLEGARIRPTRRRPASATLADFPEGRSQIIARYITRPPVAAKTVAKKSADQADGRPLLAGALLELAISSAAKLKDRRRE